MKNINILLLIIIAFLISYIVDSKFSKQNFIEKWLNKNVINVEQKNITTRNNENNSQNNNSDEFFYNNAQTKTSKNENIINDNDFNYSIKQYSPISKKDCIINKEKLGLTYCPVEKDYLAGAALACGNINNIPSRSEMRLLAQKIYNVQTTNPSIYGNRDDNKLKNMNIYAHDSHIFYWVGEEETSEYGVVRMFASKGSLEYKAARDGSGYISKALGKVPFGNTKYIKTAAKNDSNLVGLPNNDVLILICK